MMKIITMLSFVLTAGVSMSFAQEGPRNPRIASAEVNTDASEKRFIEGISLEAPTVKRKINNAEPNSAASVNNRRNNRRNPVVAEPIETEPAPIFKDKMTAKMQIAEGMKQSPLLYGFIEDWYGTPYRMGGTTKRAIDCSAFTRQLFSDVYDKSLDRTAAMQFMMTKRIFDKDELKEGDLVFFSIRTKRISHVGVYVGNGKFVHASSSRGVIISDLDQAYWARYYSGAGRY